MAYLAARSFKNAQMNELLAWMEDQQADGEYSVEHFIINYEDTWSQWVDSATAKKIKKAVSALEPFIIPKLLQFADYAN